MKILITTVFWATTFLSLDAAADVTLLNVSYDPTREFYQQFNAAFAKHWRAKTSEKVDIKACAA